MIEKDLTGQILGAVHEVHDVLGFGFLEAVYGNALYKELQRRGLKCECQKKLDVYYKGECVGHYIADMVVEDKVLLELKAVTELRPEHEWQILNYLAASKMEIGLLVNFGHRIETRRKIYTEDQKRKWRNRVVPCSSVPKKQQAQDTEHRA